MANKNTKEDFAQTQFLDLDLIEKYQSVLAQEGKKPSRKIAQDLDALIGIPYEQSSKKYSTIISDIEKALADVTCQCTTRHIKKIEAVKDVLNKLGGAAVV